MDEKPWRHTWFGEPGDLGLPQLVPWSFGTNWAAQIESVIARDLTKHVQPERR